MTYFLGKFFHLLYAPDVESKGRMHGTLSGVVKLAGNVGGLLLLRLNCQSNEDLLLISLHGGQVLSLIELERFACCCWREYSWGGRRDYRENIGDASTI